MGLTEGLKNSSGDLPVGWRKRSRRVIRHGFFAERHRLAVRRLVGRPFCKSGGAQRRHRASVDRLDHGLPGPRPYMDKLAKAQAKREHKRPTLEIEPHDSAYYQDDAPKISDAGCDAPRLRFNAIKARFPEFVSLLDFRFAAHCGPKSDIAPCRESATGLNRSRGRVRGKRHGRASNGWKPWSVLPDDEGPEARPQNRRSSA